MTTVGYRAKVLICVAALSLLSLIATISNLRISSNWKTAFAVIRNLESSEERQSSPTLPSSNITLIWNETARAFDVARQHALYFEKHLTLLPDRQLPLSNESRLRIIRDYFESKTRFYASSTPRKTPRRFYSHPSRIPALSEAKLFSHFSISVDADSDELPCYIEGANMTASLQQRRCVCVEEWKGRHCSLPSLMVAPAVKDALLAQPRRVVYVMVLNHEIEQALTTMSLLWDVVDMFVISEMNMTHYGDARPWFIQQLLETGAFEPYEQKIFYVPCSFADPRRCLEHNSFVCENSKYACLEEDGIRSIAGLRDDDLIIYTDADELLPAELVHALRYHETIYHHFAARLNWFMYGCAWKVIGYSSITKFAAKWSFVKAHSLLALRGRRGEPVPVAVMNIHPAGSHCSWCFDVAGMQLKMISAVNSDYPRWGDYAALVDAKLIEYVISRGTFFNLEDMLLGVAWSSVKHEPFSNASYCTRFRFDDATASS